MTAASLESLKYLFKYVTSPGCQAGAQLLPQNWVNTYKFILQRTTPADHSCPAPASTTSSCWKDTWINEPKNILRRSRKCSCTVSLNLVNIVVPLKQERDTFLLMVSICSWSSTISGVLWIFLQPSGLICTAGCWWGTRPEIRRNGLFPGFLWHGSVTYL